MQFAVIKTGGKQYKVAEGDILTIEKLNHDGGEVVFTQRRKRQLDIPGIVFNKEDSFKIWHEVSPLVN